MNSKSYQIVNSVVIQRNRSCQTDDTKHYYNSKDAMDLMANMYCLGIDLRDYVMNDGSWSALHQERLKLVKDLILYITGFAEITQARAVQLSWMSIMTTRLGDS